MLLVNGTRLLLLGNSYCGDSTTDLHIITLATCLFLTGCRDCCALLVDGPRVDSLSLNTIVAQGNRAQ